jgi:hypothetical protein
MMSRFAICHFVVPQADKMSNLNQKTGRGPEKLAKLRDDKLTSTHDVQSSDQIPPIVSEPVDHPMAEDLRPDTPVSNQPRNQDTEVNESSVVRETIPDGELAPSNALATTSRVSPTDDVFSATVSGNLQPAFVDNEINAWPPSLLAVSTPPTSNDSTSLQAQPTGSPTSMDMSLSPDIRVNGHRPISRKRSFSPSPHSDSHFAERRQASHGPFDTITNETTFPQTVKQEGISETEVLQFLNTVPLRSKAPNDNNNGYTRITVPAREPCRIEFGPEMVVIAAQRGSSSGATMTFNFDIDDTQMSLISKWKNRFTSQEYVLTECIATVLLKTTAATSRRAFASPWLAIAGRRSSPQ